MDWQNERYVRLYVRDTDDLMLLGWQARALLWELMRKADRAGIVETRRAARGLAAITRIPAEVVESALPELLEGEGAPVLEHPRGYVLRNFMEAQETRSSDALRARESRGRRRDLALAPDVTKRDANVTKRDVGDTTNMGAVPLSNGISQTSSDVTKRDGTVTNRDDGVTICDASVTRRHTASHGVTDRHSSPLSLPSLPSYIESGKQTVTKRDASDLTPGVSPQTPSPQSTEASEGVGRKARRAKRSETPLPPDWQPNESAIELARDMHLDLTREVRAFRDHALSKGRMLVDWQAGFRNWLVKSADFKPHTSRRNGQWTEEFDPL